MDEEKKPREEINLDPQEMTYLFQQVQMINSEEVERKLLEERVTDTQKLKEDLAALKDIQAMFPELLEQQGEKLEVAEGKVEQAKEVVQQTQEILERMPRPWWYKLGRCTII